MTRLRILAARRMTQRHAAEPATQDAMRAWQPERLPVIWPDPARHIATARRYVSVARVAHHPGVRVAHLNHAAYFRALAQKETAR